jgi:hypothetical protein
MAPHIEIFGKAAVEESDGLALEEAFKVDVKREMS